MSGAAAAGATGAFDFTSFLVDAPLHQQQPSAGPPGESMTVVEAKEAEAILLAVSGDGGPDVDDDVEEAGGEQGMDSRCLCRGGTGVVGSLERNCN